MNFVSICRSLSEVRPIVVLRLEHVHHFGIAVGADQQAHRPFGHDLVIAGVWCRVHALDALLDVAEQHRALRRFLFEAVDEGVALRERLLGLLDDRAPLLARLGELIEPRALGAQLGLQPIDRVFGGAQVGFDLLLALADRRAALPAGRAMPS